MKNVLKKVVGFEFVCTFVPATSSCNQLVSDNNSCLDNPVGQASSLWLVAAWCRCLPIGLFILSQRQRQKNATSRNHPARTAANTAHTFSAPRPHPKQDGPATCSHRSRVFTAISAIKRVFRNDGAGQLPASITFAAFPPAAFFHTNFVNLACLGMGRIA